MKEGEAVLDDSLLEFFVSLLRWEVDVRKNDRQI